MSIPLIDALITGRFVNCKEHDNLVTGRILMADETPIQFYARRGIVKTQLLQLVQGMPLSVAGQFTASIKQDKQGRPYVLHEIFISAVLTAFHPSSNDAANL